MPALVPPQDVPQPAPLKAVPLDKRISLRHRLLAMQPGGMEVVPVGETSVHSMQRAVQSALAKDDTLRARQGEYTQCKAWLCPNGGEVPQEVVIITRSAQA